MRAKQQEPGTDAANDSANAGSGLVHALVEPAEAADKREVFEFVSKLLKRTALKMNLVI